MCLSISKPNPSFYHSVNPLPINLIFHFFEQTILKCLVTRTSPLQFGFTLSVMNPGPVFYSFVSSIYFFSEKKMNFLVWWVQIFDCEEHSRIWLWGWFAPTFFILWRSRGVNSLINSQFVYSFIYLVYCLSLSINIFGYFSLQV